MPGASALLLLLVGAVTSFDFSEDFDNADLHGLPLALTGQRKPHWADGSIKCWDGYLEMVSRGDTSDVGLNTGYVYRNEVTDDAARWILELDVYLEGGSGPGGMDDTCDVENFRMEFYPSSAGPITPSTPITTFNFNDDVMKVAFIMDARNKRVTVMWGAGGHLQHDNVDFSVKGWYRVRLSVDAVGDQQARATWTILSRSSCSANPVTVLSSWEVNIPMDLFGGSLALLTQASQCGDVAVDNVRFLGDDSEMGTVSQSPMSLTATPSAASLTMTASRSRTPSAARSSGAPTQSRTPVVSPSSAASATRSLTPTNPSPSAIFVSEEGDDAQLSAAPLSVGIIIGGVSLAALVVVGGIVGVIMWRRRKRRHVRRGFLAAERAFELGSDESELGGLISRPANTDPDFNDAATLQDDL